jgi:CRP-like cAMP-binding protein
MPLRRRPSFNLPSRLAKIGAAFDYCKGQIVFSQRDVADGVFYIQKGEVKLSVLSGNGKEAIARDHLSKNFVLGHISRQGWRRRSDG